MYKPNCYVTEVYLWMCTRDHTVQRRYLEWVKVSINRRRAYWCRCWGGWRGWWFGVCNVVRCLHRVEAGCPGQAGDCSGRQGSVIEEDSKAQRYCFRSLKAKRSVDACASDRGVGASAFRHVQLGIRFLEMSWKNEWRATYNDRVLIIVWSTWRYCFGISL